MTKLKFLIYTSQQISRFSCYFLRQTYGDEVVYVVPTCHISEAEFSFILPQDIRRKMISVFGASSDSLGKFINLSASAERKTDKTIVKELKEILEKCKKIQEKK